MNNQSHTPLKKHYSLCTVHCYIKFIDHLMLVQVSDLIRQNEQVTRVDAVSMEVQQKR